MEISFSKMQGLGNDFVVLNALNESIKLNPEAIKKMADRRLGIGCDQLLVIEPSIVQAADFQYSIYNSDGSEAEQCGNGLRCIVRYLHDKKLINGNPVTLACKAGLMEAEIEKNNMVKVDMGPPIFDPVNIPLEAKAEQLIYTIEIGGAEIHIGAISMGNPHAIVCVDDLDTVDINEVGAAISQYTGFKKGANVSFMEVTQPYHCNLRVYERGAGQTPACGSAACAAMVYGQKLGILDKEVSVIQPGGELLICWAGGQNHVYMIGPAETVFSGQWSI